MRYNGIPLFSDVVRLFRPHHYVKNSFIWLPVFFAYQLTDPAVLLMVFAAFTAFCLTASTIYIINDLLDAPSDRQHPVKRHRPIAAGRLYPREAVALMGMTAGCALLISMRWLPINAGLLIATYAMLNVAYSLTLKHRAIIDIICIAVGFVIRICVGGFTANVPISPWILILTFLLALFLGMGKRYHDLILLAPNADRQSIRKSLNGYSTEFLATAMGCLGAVVIMAYILYTVTPEVTARHHSEHLYLTALWVVTGILRYLQLTLVIRDTGSPTRVLLTDFPLGLSIVGWLITFYWLHYAKSVAAFIMGLL